MFTMDLSKVIKEYCRRAGIIVQRAAAPYAASRHRRPRGANVNGYVYWLTDERGRAWYRHPTKSRWPQLYNGKPPHHS